MLSLLLRLYYDGQDDLLFNLDNRNFFYYGFLLDYLHLMVEGRNPLAAYMRASSRSHASQSHTKSVPIATLRAGWNSFSRLLDINFKSSFLCPICGVEPSTVISDGTMLGFRKDLISHLPAASQPSSPIIVGSKHADRVLLRSARSRELLLNYAGVTRDRKKVKQPKPLSQSEMKALCSSINKDGFTSLVTLVQRLSSQSGTYTCPEPYREFLSELSRNSPACGLLQLGDNTEAVDSLRAVIQQSINVQDTSSHRQLSALQTHAPIIAEFVCRCPKTSEAKLPGDVCSVMEHVLERVQRTYLHPLPPPSSYPPTNDDDDHWSFFPNLPLVRGKGNYAADTTTTQSDGDACRKASYGHPTLTPGIFTIYCPHGICYGFQAMKHCESPRHPFEIFTNRFRTPPSILVYDNACKLHVYCLNREPARYTNTRFFVDRFHWKGHVGCSRGYCMDAYKNMDTKHINSQINEQANAGLQRIKGQLAYMKPANFMFTLSLFLAITNQDKICKIDVSTLRI